MFENLHWLYSFKVLHATNFTMITEKTTTLCKNVVLTHGQLNFSDRQKFNRYSFSNFSVKAKRSEIIFKDPLISVEKTDL